MKQEETRYKQVIPGRLAGAKNEPKLETTQQKRPLCQSSSNMWGMSPLSSLKSGSMIQLLLLPNSKENARPAISQGANRDRMALAFSSFALVVLQGPELPSPAPVSTLEKRVAPRLDAAQTAMCFVVCPTLVEDWGGTSEGLPTAGTLVAGRHAEYCVEITCSKKWN